MQKKRTKKTINKTSNGTSVGSFGSLNEGFIPTAEQSQEILDKFKSIINTRLDKLYSTKGADGELYAYGIAVNQVKKKAEQPEETPTTEEQPTEEPMDKETKLKEMIQAALSKPLDEATPVKEGNHNAKDFRPYIAKDPNHPNFLKVFIQYPTQTGFSTALGQRTMTGQDREYNVEKAMKIGQAVAAKLESKYNLEDLDVYDNEDGKVIVFAVSDDFIGMNTPSIDESFPDLTGDGKVTKADILKGRGVIDEFETDEELIADEPISEDLDLGHTDDEPHMLKSDLYDIGKYAIELYKMVNQFEGKQEVDFPHWWQAKIIKAKELISSAKHYLEFELKEPQLDSIVDAASEEDVIDEKLKPSMGAGAYVDDFRQSDAPQFKGKSKKKKQKMAVAAYLSAKDKIKEAILAKLKDRK